MAGGDEEGDAGEEVDCDGLEGGGEVDAGGKMPGQLIHKKKSTKQTTKTTWEDASLHQNKQRRVKPLEYEEGRSGSSHLSICFRISSDLRSIDLALKRRKLVSDDSFFRCFIQREQYLPDTSNHLTLFVCKNQAAMNEDKSVEGCS